MKRFIISYYSYNWIKCFHFFHPLGDFSTDEKSMCDRKYFLYFPAVVYSMLLRYFNDVTREEGFKVWVRQ